MGTRLVEDRRAPIEYEKLSQYLKALANPNRLEMLDKLRFPKSASELRLTPKRSLDTGNKSRSISRQAVEEHLEILEAIGVVTKREGQRDGRPVDEYAMNHARLFALVEEFRKLTLLRATSVEDASATMDADAKAAGPWEEGPKLVVVSGPWEGRVLTLRGGPGPWSLGRKRGASVLLDYDPFVSQENARIVLDKDGWFVEDLPGSKNGTFVNFRPVPTDGRAPLRNGDVLGVGRTLMVFRDA